MTEEMPASSGAPEAEPPAPALDDETLSALIPLGDLAPDTVYLKATTLLVDAEPQSAESAASLACADGLSTLANRHEYALGFPCDSPSVAYRGNVLYVDDAGDLRRFVIDVESSEDPSTLDYPQGPEADDPVIPTAACPHAVATTGVFGGSSLVASPHGELGYRCDGDEGGWYSLNDGREVAPAQSDLLAFHRDTSLVHWIANPSDEPDALVPALFTPPSTFLTPVQGVASKDRVYAARAVEGGFFVAIGEQGVRDVLFVTLEGEATSLHDAPLREDPRDLLLDTAGLAPVLDGLGRAYGAFGQDVVRVEPDGTRTVVSEMTDGWVARPSALGQMLLDH